MTGGQIVCFGELLLRLSPDGHERLAEAGRFECHVGGAEGNVAAALATLGRPSAMLSAVPDTALGARATGELARAGVDIRGVVTAPGRMGLYWLERGGGLRRARIVYDRAGSSFAGLAPDRIDWQRALADAALLHLSGIVPALGPGGVRLALAACDAAAAAGVPVSFDGNYRAQLWAAWDGDPRRILTDIVARATLLFGDRRDAALLLGREFASDDSGAHDAAAACFDAFPALRLMASTSRARTDGGAQTLAARVDTRTGGHATAPVALGPVIDRIGTGDAYVAGVIDQWLDAPDDVAGMATQGLAMAALAHGLPGDMPRITRAELSEFDPAGADVSR
jgi:2-dehydro-3-deoxygluconokinase